MDKSCLPSINCCINCHPLHFKICFQVVPGIVSAISTSLEKKNCDSSLVWSFLRKRVKRADKGTPYMGLHVSPVLESEFRPIGEIWAVE